MHVNLGIWDKLTRVVVFLLFAAGVAAVCFWSFPLLEQNKWMRQRLLQLDTQIRQAEQSSKSLKAQTEAAKNDPRTIERLARMHFGYARPGEFVIRFEEPKR